MTYAERVQHFRAAPPKLGSSGDAYRRGYAGGLVMWARGSINAAAYRAGVLNACSKEQDVSRWEDEGGSI